MPQIEKLFKQNQEWVERINQQTPGFFEALSKQQSPEYLWVGCSDSRVPANEILGLLPGDVFVHRNVGNLVVHSDLNCLSVLQYAVDVLKIKHVLVCGHYGCGGIKAAVDNESHGLIDNWLRHVQDVAYKHKNLLKCDQFEHDNSIAGKNEKENKNKKYEMMCDLNVIEQVLNVTKTTVIQDAWKRGQSVTVHGCVYSLSNGLLNRIAFGIDSDAQVNSFYDQAIKSVKASNL